MQLEFIYIGPMSPSLYSAPQALISYDDFPSRKETRDFNTPSNLSSRTSVNRALYRGSPTGTTSTIQSDGVSISNSSVHNTSTADLFDYTEQYPGGVYSISHRKSFHSLENRTFRFRNQSQSTVGTIREAGSDRSSIIATSTSTPSNIPSFEDENEPLDVLLLEASTPVFPDPHEARAREARVLESKVARVASRNFSVEEVVALQEEVDRWLTEVTAADAPTAALFLSSLLLKAILVNHFVFSDASKTAKSTEMSLKLKVDELELEKGRLEVELQNQVSYSNLLTLFRKVQYDQKVQSLRIELNRFVTTPSVSSTSRSSASSPSSRVAAPTCPSNIALSLSRLGFIR
ncbi:hypothetical protein BGY98DRAFT_1183675 [Russula aff. rugulosa BPL654]|nr:hypothetical protein BGY98DRAFT_1183675 [Russula aff. rugulosa BPL654]